MVAEDIHSKTLNFDHYIDYCSSIFLCTVHDKYTDISFCVCMSKFKSYMHDIFWIKNHVPIQHIQFTLSVYYQIIYLYLHVLNNYLKLKLRMAQIVIYFTELYMCLLPKHNLSYFYIMFYYFKTCMTKLDSIYYYNQAIMISQISSWIIWTIQS